MLFFIGKLSLMCGSCIVVHIEKICTPWKELGSGVGDFFSKIKVPLKIAYFFSVEQFKGVILTFPTYEPFR